jgi:ABC-type Fe3+ transport system permease subunit
MVFWIILIFHIMWDIMRSHDLNGWLKALWVVFILVLPLLGGLIYLIVRGGSMQERDTKRSLDQQKAFEDYIRKIANSNDDAPQSPQS